MIVPKKKTNIMITSIDKKTFLYITIYEYEYILKCY